MYILLEIFHFQFIVGLRIRTPGRPVYDTNRLAHKARRANHYATLATTKNRGSSYGDIAACPVYTTFWTIR